MRQLVKLKDIASHSKGSQINGDELIEGAKYDYLNGGINPSGKWNESNCEAGTIAISEGGNSCGYVNYMREPFWCGAHCYYLYDTVKNTQYLYYALKSQQEQIMKLRSGACMPNIKKSDLGNFEFMFDNNEVEQEKITSILSKLEKIIEAHREELQSFDELVKARFVEMFGDPYSNPFGWKKLKIKDAVEVEPQNGLYKPQLDYVSDGSGIPILRIDAFYDGKVTDFSKLKRLICNEDEKNRYMLKEDDIVINRVNSLEYLGKCAHIQGLIEDTVYESNMMRMHFCSEYFNSVYVTQLLCSQFIYDQIVNHAKKAVNQASINQKDVLDFDIYEPPMEIQNQFAEFIKKLDKSKVAIQKSLDETQLLFDSLMQEYFG